MQKTSDINVVETRALPSPAALLAELPKTEAQAEFVARTRIEKARHLLQNPKLRVSEIAFEVGFQSLTHFNRVFKNVVGESPTEFRARLPKAA